MAKAYYLKVKAGTMQVDDVPALWRNAVKALVEADGE